MAYHKYFAKAGMQLVLYIAHQFKWGQWNNNIFFFPLQTLYPRYMLMHQIWGKQQIEAHISSIRLGAFFFLFLS